MKFTLILLAFVVGSSIASAYEYPDYGVTGHGYPPSTQSDDSALSKIFGLIRFAMRVAKRIIGVVRMVVGPRAMPATAGLPYDAADEDADAEEYASEGLVPRPISAILKVLRVARALYKALHPTALRLGLGSDGSQASAPAPSLYQFYPGILQQ